MPSNGNRLDRFASFSSNRWYMQLARWCSLKKTKKFQFRFRFRLVGRANRDREVDGPRKVYRARKKPLYLAHTYRTSRLCQHSIRAVSVVLLSTSSSREHVVIAYIIDVIVTNSSSKTPCNGRYMAVTRQLHPFPEIGHFAYCTGGGGG